MSRTRAGAMVAVVALVAALCGCAEKGTRTVSILGPWPPGDPEGEQFVAALDAFERKTGSKVDYTGSSAVAQVLKSEVQKGTPPDIAILPSPGDVAVYEKELTPLGGILGADWTDSYTDQWQRLAQAGLPKLMAVPVKADLKGLVWFTLDHLDRPPATFAELSALTDELVAEGQTPWCLGVARQVTSGWPGTDWIEDILLRQSGVEVYQRFAAGELPWTSPAVRAAWTTWGDLVTRPNQVYGGTKAALLTDFSDAARPMFTTPEPGCVMEHQASFMSGFYRTYDGHPVPGRDFDFFQLPPFEAATSADAAQPVSADLAGLFNDTPEARALIRFLVSVPAQEMWPVINAFSANKRVPRNAYDAMGQRIASALTGTNSSLCFDASDLMPDLMRSVFYRVVLEYLADPDRLDALLADLEKVNQGLPDTPRLKVACGNEESR